MKLEQFTESNSMNFMNLMLFLKEKVAIESWPVKRIETEWIQRLYKKLVLESWPDQIIRWIESNSWHDFNEFSRFDEFDRNFALEFWPPKTNSSIEYMHVVFGRYGVNNWFHNMFVR